MSATTGVGEHELTITPFDGPLAEAHARFAHRMWPTKRRRREERFNRWKFRGPERGPVPGLLLAVVDGAVVGQCGLIPATLAVDGKVVACQWVCDIMVDPVARRRRVASRLLESAMSRGMVTLGHNPSPAADVTMQRVGFESFRGPAIAVLPLDPSHVVSWKLPARLQGLSPVIGAALRPVLARRSRSLDDSKRPPAERAEATGWRDIAPRVRDHQSRLEGPYIVHDDAFLSWRCAGLTGFVEPLSALRAGRTGYAIVGQGGPYLYVFDWGAENAEEFIRLFSAVRTMALAVGAKTVEAYADTGEQLAWLRDSGFFVMRRPCQILCHPGSTFRPKYARMNYSIFDSDGNL